MEGRVEKEGGKRKVVEVEGTWSGVRLMVRYARERYTARSVLKLRQCSNKVAFPFEVPYLVSRVPRQLLGHMDDLLRFICRRISTRIFLILLFLHSAFVLQFLCFTNSALGLIVNQL